jgi:Protein of unknown function (DUF5818)
MPKTLLLLLTLVFSAAWIQAQESQQSPQTPSSHSTGTMSGTAGTQAGGYGAGETTVEGCLHASGGNYTLTDSSGNTYQLQGDTATLSEHNGHEVQITGTKSGSTSGSSSSSMSSGGSQLKLTVQKLKHISKTCKTGAMSK